jgi:phosphoribosylamine--glycine ligase
MDCASYPAVLKADGLAAGKGVVIAASPREAKQALRDCFLDRRFGEAGSRVLVEEFLEGEELSLLALCDGEQAVPMAPAQDFKRIGEGDTGPNTGGMGSYSPVPGVGAEQAREITRAVHQPIIDTLRARGIAYRGVLYAGLMMTPTGRRVLEFNCRFGDPETQAVLPRLRSDVLDALEGCLEPGGLQGMTLDWSEDSAVTVVLASAGYPVSSSKGDVITGLDEVGDVEITHAGTARRGNDLVTAGGRVLNVTGLGPTLEEARGRAFAAVGRIQFDGAQYRPDIAARVAERVALTGH